MIVKGKFKTSFAILAIFLGFIGNSWAQSTNNKSVNITEGTVLKNVSVVDTRSGAIAKNMAVVVNGNKIQKIAKVSRIQTSGSARSIDASGKFIVPGYLDMHAHGMRTPENQPNTWRLMLANGVTGFRQMNGSAKLVQIAKKTNAASAAGQLDAPEILIVPGDIVRGQFRTPEAGVKFVRDLKAQRADFMKLIAGPPPVAMAMLLEAKKLGIYVAGHLPRWLPAAKASNLGWRSMEHFGAGWGFILDCANAAPGVRKKLASGKVRRLSFRQTFYLTPHSILAI